jgi:hypothetical protein
MQTLDDLQGQIHQGNVAGYARLLSLGANPVAVAFANDVLHAQVHEVDVGKPGETGKDKHRARRLKIACGQWRNHDALQFFFVEDFSRSMVWMLILKPMKGSFAVMLLALATRNMVFKVWMYFIVVLCPHPPLVRIYTSKSSKRTRLS